MAVSTPNLYPVVLTPEQRTRLEDITRNGSAPAKKIRHAQVLLLSDGGRPGGRLTRDQIAQRLDMHVNTVDRIRRRFVTEGEAPALDRKPRLTPPVPAKIDGRVEAHLVAICCSQAPEGRTRWTLQLLADELKHRGLVTHVCAETVRQALKKPNCSLGGSSAGASPSATTPASSRRWKTSSTCTRPRTRRTSP
jgi:transposase